MKIKLVVISLLSLSILSGCASNKPYKAKKKVERPTAQLIQPIIQNDFKKVDELLATGIDINMPPYEGYSMNLWYYLLDSGRGVARVSPDTIQKLIDRGLDPKKTAYFDEDKRFNRFSNLLNKMANNCQADMVEVVLKNSDLDINAKSGNYGKTPLLTAAAYCGGGAENEEQRWSTIEKLIQLGADPYAVDEQGKGLYTHIAEADARHRQWRKAYNEQYYKKFPWRDTRKQNKSTFWENIGKFVEVAAKVAYEQSQSGGALSYDALATPYTSTVQTTPSQQGVKQPATSRNLVDRSQQTLQQGHSPQKIYKDKTLKCDYPQFGVFCPDENDAECKARQQANQQKFNALSDECKAQMTGSNRKSSGSSAATTNAQ